MRLLWGMLIRSNRQCVIVISLVSLTWQLLYKVSALQNRKRGCFWTQGRARAAAFYQGGYHSSPASGAVMLWGSWSASYCTELCTWLVSHLWAGSNSQGTVLHQRFEMRAAASPAAGAWWCLVSVVEDHAELQLVFAVSQLNKSLDAVQFINGGMHIDA